MSTISKKKFGRRALDMISGISYNSESIRRCVVRIQGQSGPVKHSRRACLLIETTGPSSIFGSAQCLETE